MLASVYISVLSWAKRHYKLSFYAYIPAHNFVLIRYPKIIFHTMGSHNVSLCIAIVKE